MAKRTDLPVQDFRENLADHIRRAADRSERFVITRRGKPQAALVSMADLEKLEQLDASSRSSKRRR